MSQSLLLFLKGVFMGSADIVPGVSGGTIALIVGIYEQLINAIKAVDPRIVVYALMAPFRREYRARTRDLFFAIPFQFLLPLGLGIGVAFLTLAHAISGALDTYPTYTYALFFGLILASAIIVYRAMDAPSAAAVPPALAGFVLAFAVVGMTAVSLSHDLPAIAVSGAVAISAMILPGISGAFILLLLGQYEFMLEALLSRDLAVIMAFGAGAAGGLVVFSRILSALFARYRTLTLAFLLGLMLGGLRVPAEAVIGASASVPVTLFCAAAGFGSVIALERMSTQAKK